jgi:hypothetical protein
LYTRSGATPARLSRDPTSATISVIDSIYPWNIGYSVMRDTYIDAAAAFGNAADVP